MNVKRWMLAFGLALVVLFAGAAKCEPEVKSDAYEWEVYASVKPANQCDCNKPDKIDLSKPEWQRSEVLVLIKYGFTGSDGRTKTKTKTGETTPWTWTEHGPKDAITLELWAQAADNNVTLVCVLYADGLKLGAYVGPGDGTCSASHDL